MGTISEVADFSRSESPLTPVNRLHLVSIVSVIDGSEGFLSRQPFLAHQTDFSYREDLQEGSNFSLIQSLNGEEPLCCLTKSCHQRSWSLLD